MREQITGISAAGFGGTAVGLVLGIVTLPLVAVSAGAVTAFLLARRFDVHRHYDSVATVFFLSLGALVYLIPFFPIAFKQTPQLFLVVFGLISAAIVVSKRSVSDALGAVDGKLRWGNSASSVSNAIASVLGVTPAMTVGSARTRADATAPDPDEDVATINTKPSDGTDESFESADSTATDERGTDSAGGVNRSDPDTPGGQDPRSTRSNGLEASAKRLGLPSEPGPVSEGIETMTSAIDAVIDETDAVADGVVDREADPVERATSVRRAADGGTLLAGETKSEGRPDRRGESVEQVPSELTGAVRTARTRVSPQSSEAQELLDTLELAGDVSERHLTDAVGEVIATLNSQAELATALAEVDPNADTRELARHLDRHGSDIDGPAGTGLSTVADELDGAVSELEECRAQRQRLAENAESVCTAANDQTTVQFDSTASTDQWLDALTDSVTDGTISVTDQANDIGALVSTAEQEVRPQSSLARSVVEALRSDSMDADARERTIADAIAAIDSTETLRHRLEDVSVDDVETLAGRLQQDLDGMNTAGSTQLADRVEELRRMVTSADAADRLTVYAARQELRFYDQQLLDALQESPDPGETDGPVAEQYREVEQRRSRMRTEYPENYPNHDHSIPIHFLELVDALQESADQARTSGNEERAVGYLQAADRTLDWVAELYDRHAYSVLLEQLRG